MTEFKINEFITLKLEHGTTNIYVKGELFNQCKMLLMDIQVDNIDTYEYINSIDEIAEKLGWDGEVQRGGHYDISSKTEFWGHCSNIQAWVEQNYDTRLLHSNLSFPLLKRLVDAGDTKANVVFKEEIAKRIDSGYIPVLKYLYNEGYFKYLDLKDTNLDPYKRIQYAIPRWIETIESNYFEILSEFNRTSNLNAKFEIIVSNFIESITAELKEFYESLKELNLLEFLLTASDMDLIGMLLNLKDALHINRFLVWLNKDIPDILSQNLSRKAQMYIMSGIDYKFFFFADYIPINVFEQVIENSTSTQLVEATRVFVNIEPDYTEKPLALELFLTLKHIKSLLISDKIEVIDIFLEEANKVGWEYYYPLIEDLKKNEPEAFSIELMRRVKLCILDDLLDYMNFLESQDISSLINQSVKDLFYILLSKFKAPDGSLLHTDSESEIFEFFYTIINPLMTSQHKKRLIHILKAGDKRDLILILNFRWLESFTKDELRQIIKNPKISFNQRFTRILANKDTELYLYLFLFHKLIRYFGSQYRLQIIKGFSDEEKEIFVEKLIIKLNTHNYQKEVYMISYNILKNISKPEDNKKYNFTFRNYGRGKTYSELNISPNSVEHKKLYSIKEVVAIDKLRHLKKLVLKSHHITELQDLETLKNLEELNLSYNGITVISGLESLAKLKILNLSNNRIHYITNLEKLKNLEILDLDSNLILEIPKLETLPNLKKLVLTRNKISEIKNLESFSTLEDLTIAGANLTEITGLEKLTNLRRLNLSNNQIKEIKGLETQTQLETLFLNNNIIREIKGLSNLGNLKTLYLGDNQITELKGLKNLVNLETLNLSHNKISEIKGLYSLSKLKKLDLYGNLISKIAGLENLKCLRDVSLYRNNIPESDIRRFLYDLFEKNRVKTN